MAAGDESNALDIALEHEASIGPNWVATSLGLAEGELKADGGLPANLLPGWERGELIDAGWPPEYEVIERQAARAAGVR